VPQRFFTKFPKKINRVKLSDNRDRNRSNSEIQSGYLDISKVHLSHTCLLRPPPRSVLTGKIAGEKDEDVERERLADTLRPGVLAGAS
jgi:hypothetical protein